VLGYAVALRQREIGLRTALGADAPVIHRLVLRQGLRPVAVGVVAGTVVTVAGGRAIGSLLHDGSPMDPIAIVVATAVLAIVSAAVCLVPAIRAARVDPVVALRAD
jgi:ABC-type antimicrobial peptide transport system permease subunit